MRGKLKNMFGLDGKVAIVTGGMGLLGKEFVKTLKGAGAKVAIFDIETKKYPKEFEKVLRDKNVAFYKTDVTDKNSVKRSLKAVLKKWGTPQILVNAAAIDARAVYSLKKSNLLETYPKDEWDKIMNVNVDGTFLCSQIIGTEMAKNNGGSIINISSIYGEISPDQRTYMIKEKGTYIKPISYCVSKGAIPNLTRYLATYWAKKNVRVNTLTFGGVYNYQNKRFVRNYSFRVPMGRMARRDEYNGAVLFLASDASSYMTGANIVIDGGYTAW